MADINIGQITEALNDKMDLDSGNANPAIAKQAELATLASTVEQLQNRITSLQGEISNMLGRIDYVNTISGSIVSAKSGSTITNGSYTIPADGYFYIPTVAYSNAGHGSSASFYIRVNNIRVSSLQTVSNNSDVSWGIIAPTAGSFIFVSKNDIITLEMTTTTTRTSGQTLTGSYVFFPQKI